MSLPIPQAVKPPKIQTKPANNWLAGTVSVLDDGRTPLDGLRSSGNMILEQDGVLRPRPSLQLYGPQPIGTVLGELFQYRSLDGLTPTNWLISMQVSGSVGRICVAEPSDTSWTTVTGIDYDATAPAHFVQSDSKVVILNGTDTLSYYDINDGTLTNFAALDNATAATATPTGLSGSDYTISYMITANSSVGETSGVAVDQLVSTDRDLWDSATQSIALAWTPVAGNKSQNVYVSVTADSSGDKSWGLLASGLSSSTSIFTDTGSGPNGTGAPNTFRTPPDTDDNSTAGPKASRGEAINGQLWLTGVADHPYYVYHDGGSGFPLDFTPSNGGGFVQLGNGGVEVPVKVFNFRSGQGDPQIKVLTKGLNGQGKRYTITSSTLSAGNGSFTVWGPNEDYGSSGTDSPDGVISYNNSAYYPSKDGFKVIGTKPQLQNLLSNDDTSQTIQPDMAFLNSSAMDNACGVAFENRLYWALPVGQTFNNEIWVLDLARKGAWMKPWSINADWICLVADNGGYSHLVVVQGDNIYELSYNTLTSDNGIPFATSGTTGLNYFADDKQQWGRLIKVVISVLRPQGKTNFSISGFTNKQIVEPLGSAALDETVNTSGYGWSEGGWSTFGWGDFTYTPDLTGVVSKDITIKVNKDVKYWSLNWSSSEAGVDYAISESTPQFINIGIKNLAN